MEIALELIQELTKDESMMWVVGGGPVVSENHAKGIQQPQNHNGNLTVEADNWHFHIKTSDVAGIQFVETKTHGERLRLLRAFLPATTRKHCSAATSPPVPGRRLQAHTAARRQAQSLHRYAG